jgi:hypothetical protein
MITPVSRKEQSMGKTPVRPGRDSRSSSPWVAVAFVLILAATSMIAVPAASRSHRLPRPPQQGCNASRPRADGEDGCGPRRPPAAASAPVAIPVRADGGDAEPSVSEAGWLDAAGLALAAGVGLAGFAVRRRDAVASGRAGALSRPAAARGARPS